MQALLALRDESVVLVQLEPMALLDQTARLVQWVLPEQEEMKAPLELLVPREKSVQLVSTINILKRHIRVEFGSDLCFYVKLTF